MTAFTAFAFEDCIENGGEAIKLGMFRAQSFKVAEKEVREGVRQEDGTMRMTGPIKRKRDDLYLVDCAVTGSSDGTAKDPKCSLQRVFEHCIFPAVQKLVVAGGKYEGYKVVCRLLMQGKTARSRTFMWGICAACGSQAHPSLSQLVRTNSRKAAST